MQRDNKPSRMGAVTVKLLESMVARHTGIEFFGTTMLIWMGLVDPAYWKGFPLVRRDNPPQGRLFQPKDYPVMLMRDDVTYIDPDDSSIWGVRAVDGVWFTYDLAHTFLFTQALEQHRLTDFWKFFSKESSTISRDYAPLAIKQWYRCAGYDKNYHQIDTARYNGELERHREIQKNRDEDKLFDRIASRFNIPAYK